MTYYPLYHKTNSELLLFKASVVRNQYITELDTAVSPASNPLRAPYANDTKSQSVKSVFESMCPNCASF